MVQKTGGGVAGTLIHHTSLPGAKTVLQSVPGHMGSWEPAHLLESDRSPSLQTFRTSTVGDRGGLRFTP